MPDDPNLGDYTIAIANPAQRDQHREIWREARLPEVDSGVCLAHHRPSVSDSITGIQGADESYVTGSILWKRQVPSRGQSSRFTTTICVLMK
jgi:hypothetical protein